MKEIQPVRGKGRHVIITDSGFGSTGLVQSLNEIGFDVVTKCRKDRPTAAFAAKEDECPDGEARCYSSAIPNGPPVVATVVKIQPPPGKRQRTDTEQKDKDKTGYYLSTVAGITPLASDIAAKLKHPQDDDEGGDDPSQSTQADASSFPAVCL